MKALENIKVLDFSQGAAGPYASMILGDFGADVIKIESPEGDWARTLGPPFIEGESAAFLSLNRNKRSIVLDLKKKESIEMVKNMIKEVDILIESFRPGVMKKFGLGYEEISYLNPKIVYCSVSGFGQKGPWKYKPGVDGIIQGISGLMSVTGYDDMPPVKAGTIVADVIGGSLALSGILIALHARKKSGYGQKVDQSLFDAMLSMQTVGFGMYFANKQLPKRHGSEAPYAVPNGAFKTKDGYIMLAANLPKKWESFCNILNKPEWLNNPKYNTNEMRVKNRYKLIPEIEKILKENKSKYWLENLEKHDIICAPTYEDIENFEQVKVNEMILSSYHPTIGEYSQIGIPQKLTETPGRLKSDAPLLGQHTDEIMEEFQLLNKNKSIPR